VRGSGIFAGGWGGQRAAVYGGPEAGLGAFYAQRTLLKLASLPEHVANAGFALSAGDPSPTPGPHIPLDPGVAAPVPAAARDRLAAAGVDLGASSGRVLAGRYGPDGVSLREVHRFANDPVRVGGVLRWDVLALFRGVLEGLRHAEEAAGLLDSVGVDGWGVDYGLLDRDGQLLGNPAHYRDGRTAAAMAEVVAAVGSAYLYAATGTQLQPFNTLFQLYADRGSPQLASAEHALLIPDLMTYWLCGALGTELTNASTTGLLDPRTMRWSDALVSRLGVPIDLFPPLRRPGQVARTFMPGSGRH